MTPGARRSEFAGVADARLRVRLAAPATDGRANAELVRLLAKALGIPRDAVTIGPGGRSRRKLVHLAGVTLDDARRRLGL